MAKLLQQLDQVEEGQESNNGLNTWEAAELREQLIEKFGFGGGQMSYISSSLKCWMRWNMRCTIFRKFCLRGFPNFIRD
jgi:hypothetical protein